MDRADVEFFKTIVAPTVADFRADPLDLRKACLCALVLASMADHHFACHPGLAKGKGAYRDQIAMQRGDFALIRDVADATKHAALRGDGGGLRFSQVQSRAAPDASGGYNQGAMAYNAAGAYWARSAIVVRDANGIDSMLDEAIFSVERYWRGVLAGEAQVGRSDCIGGEHL